MHRLLGPLVIALVLLAAPAARAGWVVEGSIGKGVQLNPSVEAEQLNVMLAPGYALPFVRLELGLVNNLPDLQASKYNLELRPMIAIVPPILPLYGRVIFAVTNLLGRDDQKTELAYGGALGLKFGLGPIGVFGEAGLLPRSRMSKLSWVLEGRLGAYLEF